MRRLWSRRALLINLVAKDLKLKYRGSILGVAWSLLNPLLLLIVYTLAFKYVMRVQMQHYAYFLMTGLLPWSFFAGALQSSTGAIVQNGALVRKVRFPHESLPVATVLFNLVQLLLAWAAFLPAMVVVYGVALPWTAALLLPLLALHVCFTCGLALLLSALSSRFRDVTHLTEVALVLLFWVTPVVYPLSMAPERLAFVLGFSPFAAFAVAYQDLLFWGRVPAPHVLLTLGAGTFVALGVGQAVFRSRSRTFAEEV
jgi:ABC-type polysaccharide/polyol phosphate export permease